MLVNRPASGFDGGLLPPYINTSTVDRISFNDLIGTLDRQLADNACPTLNNSLLVNYNSSKEGKAYHLHCGLDYYGEDLVSSPPFVINLDACLAHCDKLPKCVAVSYIQAEDRGNKGPCYLKSTFHYAIPKAGILGAMQVQYSPILPLPPLAIDGLTASPTLGPRTTGNDTMASGEDGNPPKLNFPRVSHTHGSHTNTKQYIPSARETTTVPTEASEVEVVIEIVTVGETETVLVEIQGRDGHKAAVQQDPAHLILSDASVAPMLGKASVAPLTAVAQVTPCVPVATWRSTSNTSVGSPSRQSSLSTLTANAAMTTATAAYNKSTTNLTWAGASTVPVGDYWYEGAANYLKPGSAIISIIAVVAGTIFL